MGKKTPGTPGAKAKPAAGTARVRPLYLTVVRSLQSEIVRGIFPVGSLLPSEASLVQRFAVSRQTVRSALRALRETGLVESQQGLGTRVKSVGTAQGYVHHVTTISDLFPLNVETRYDPVDGALAPAPTALRTACKLDAASQWLRISGCRYREGVPTPFNELEIYVAARFAGVGRVISNHVGSIYAAIEMIYGETVSEVSQVISGFRADATQGARIGLSPDDTGILVGRIFRIAAGNEIALISLNRYRADDFAFSLTLQRMKS